LRAWNADRTLARFERFFEGDETSWDVRSMATAAATDMWQREIALGWGAGSFRFVFPRFQRAYAEITFRRPDREQGYLFWQHAHNDWIQLPAELGWVGVSPLLLGLVYLLTHLLRERWWSHPFTLLASIGCLATVVHARVEFVFQNPAILTMWTLLAMLILMFP